MNQVNLLGYDLYKRDHAPLQAYCDVLSEVAVHTQWKRSVADWLLKSVPIDVEVLDYAYAADEESDVVRFRLNAHFFLPDLALEIDVTETSYAHFTLLIVGENEGSELGSFGLDHETLYLPDSQSALRTLLGLGMRPVEVAS